MRSEGGWETVADNTSDDKRIRRADKIGKERVAAKQKKNNNKPYRRQRYNNRPYRPQYQDDGDQGRDFYRSYGSNRSQDAGAKTKVMPRRDVDPPASLSAFIVGCKAIGNLIARTEIPKRTRN